MFEVFVLELPSTCPLVQTEKISTWKVKRLGIFLQSLNIMKSTTTQVLYTKGIQRDLYCIVYYSKMAAPYNKVWQQTNYHKGKETSFKTFFDVFIQYITLLLFLRSR